MTITLKHFPAGERGFFRAPVLLTGASEAILVDGGFTLEDGRAVAAAIQATGRQLTTIYVSQSDPDYYFSLRPICDAFPDARVIAAPDTVAAIAASVQKKLDAWGPKLGENGPRTLSDVVLPTASSDRTLVARRGRDRDRRRGRPRQPSLPVGAVAQGRARRRTRLLRRSRVDRRHADARTARGVADEPRRAREARPQDRDPRPSGAREPRATLRRSATPANTCSPSRRSWRGPRTAARSSPR